jgi:two-component system, NtrC family, sensor kinase
LRVQELETRLADALEERVALSEILRVIRQSPTDPQPVFDAIARSAMRLCESTISVVTRYDGEFLHLAAHNHVSPEADDLTQRLFPTRPSRELLHGRAVLDAAVVHLPDIQADSEYRRSIATAYHARGGLGVPMLLDGRVLGAIAVARQEVRPFSDTQIALLQTFADQAVIAIENVRLFTELEARNRDLTDALDQQTATSEILRVISSSPTDLLPVFDSIAASALRLCDAKLCTAFRFDGEFIHLIGSRHVSQEGAAAYRDAYPSRPGRQSGTHRAILTRTIVHIPDIREDAEYELRALARANDYGCVLSVPMLRDGHPVGAITVGREAARPFTNAQIELLKTFADQAVIAIENVRLFKELQTSNRELTTALDMQTATSDILRVMSHAQTDVRPVFDAILASAVRLLQGYSGVVTRVAGDQLDLAALTRTTDAGDAAVRALYPERLDSQATHVWATRNRAPLNIADAHSDPQLPEVEYTRARVRGYRSHVVVPLLSQDEAIGTIGVTRRDPGGFTDDEIALLQTFADQAVIAIENVRLFTELEARNSALIESLEQQTATAEILRVISQSPTDIQPVLDTLVESSARLCGAYDATIFLREDADRLVLAANNGPIHAAATDAYTLSLNRGTVGGRTVLEARTIHISDLQAEAEEFPEAAGNARRLGFHTMLSVPLMREGAAIGAIQLPRTEVRPFAERQVALLQTFADQAVIAIENVRLFKELQEKNRALTEAHTQVTEALDQQTATAEILRVISSSPTDIQPVLDTVAESAARLCAAQDASIFRRDGDRLVLVAHHGPIDFGPVGEAFLPLVGGTANGRSVLDGRTIHVADLQAEVDEFPEGSATARRFGQGG